MKYCINCGGTNVKVAKKDEDARVGRGDYHEFDNNFSRQSDHVVLECKDCHHEMIDLSAS